MFVPRALLKKGVRPPKKPLPTLPKAAEETASPQTLLPTRPANVEFFETTGSDPPSEDQALPLRKRKLDQTSPADGATGATKKAKGDHTTKGSNITKAEVTDAYLEEVVLGLEIFFSDHAHQDSSGWLNRFKKVIDGETGYIHLSTLISSPLLERLKPPVTHNIIHRALQLFPSDYIEEAQDGIHIRRNPSTYPLPSILDKESAAMIDDYWDCRTIYVEPALASMCIRPTSVASWLKKHGELSPKLLPIQAVQALHPSCALVVFTGSITHNSGERWLEGGQPKNWIVMSKMEHDRRTAEYEELLADETQRRLGEAAAKPITKRRAMRELKRRQAEGRGEEVIEEEKVVEIPTQETVTETTSVAFPERWTFVRLSNMPQKLALEAIFRLVKGISPRPIEAYIAFHTYGKLFVILQFAMLEDAQTVVQTFNDKVRALKEKGELEEWLTGLNSGYEHGSWNELPDKTILKNPSQADRKKMQKKKAKARRQGTWASILDIEEAKACWEQLEKNKGKTCTGAPPSE